MRFSTQCFVRSISKLFVGHFPYHDAFVVLVTKICNSSTSTEESTDSTRSKQSLLPELIDLQQTKKTEKLNLTRAYSVTANI